MIRDVIRQNSRPLQPLSTDEPARLVPLPGIRVVLFDIYGTLVISGCGDIGTSAIGDDDQDYDHSFFDALSAAEIDHRRAPGVGRELLTEAISQLHAEMRSSGVEYPEVHIPEVWQIVLNQLQQREVVTADSISQEQLLKLAVEYEVRQNPVWPMPGAHETLEALRRGGVALGLVSNAQFFTPELFPALLDRDLEELGFDSSLLQYSYIHRRAKPGTDLYRHVAEELERREISPAESLFVGNDLLNDVAAAAAVGFRTALFAGDARSLRLRTGDARVAGVVPDIVVNDLRQLPECVLDSGSAAKDQQ